MGDCLPFGVLQAKELPLDNGTFVLSTLRLHRAVEGLTGRRKKVPKRKKAGRGHDLRGARGPRAIHTAGSLQSVRKTGVGCESDEAAAEARVTEEIHSLLEAITNSSADWIIISNEVGLGLVPPYPLGRIYRDLLGRANQQVAARASEVLWLVAGIPVPIQSFRTQSLK